MVRNKLFHFFIVLFFIFGCSFSRSGKLKIGIFHTLTPINPFSHSGSLSDNLSDLIFDTLIRIDSNGKIKANISDNWTYDSSKLEWKFHIPNNILFHDGSLLGIEDVVYSLNKAFSSNEDLLAIFNTHIKEIKAEQDNYISITLSKNTFSFLASLQESKIVPKKYFADSEAEKVFYERPIGSGPFKLLQQSAQKITLVKNNQFHREIPSLNEISIQSFENENAVLNQLIGENIDFAFLLSPQDYGTLSHNKDLIIYENWYPILYSIFFNFNRSVFHDTQLKESFNLAINKKRILEEVFLNHGSCSSGTKIKNCSSDYDPIQARKLLERSGWNLSQKTGLMEKENNTLQFTIHAIAGDVISHESLKRIKEDLLEIGVKLDILALEPKVFFETVFKKKQFDLSFHMSVFRPYYQNEYAYFHSSQIEKGINISSYKDSELDFILENYAQSPNEPIAYQKLQEALENKKPALFLFWRKMPIVAHKRFKNIPEQKMESLRDLIHVYEE